MPHTETHKVTLHKPAKRNLADDVMVGNLADLITTVQTQSLKVRGWIIDADGNPAYDRQDGIDDGYKYTFRLHIGITFTGNVPPAKSELAHILKQIHVKCGQPKFGSWTLAKVDGEDYIPPTGDDDGGISGDLVAYAPVEMPELGAWNDAYSHLYGLESHIQRVYKAIAASIGSSFKNRFHVVLDGPPGCGKSDIAETVRTLLGEDAVWKIDGTAVTQAGAIKELAEFDVLPRFIIVEEIEKADPKALAFLLGVLDTRGEVRKVTARANIQRETKCVCIATVNDMTLFRSMASGALASRFTQRIHFSRPDRATLARILRREIAKLDDASNAWIQPTLDFCEAENINDPRMVISHCLVGGDDLLDGSYQKMMADTSENENLVGDYTA